MNQGLSLSLLVTWKWPTKLKLLLEQGRYLTPLHQISLGSKLLKIHCSSQHSELTLLNLWIQFNRRSKVFRGKKKTTAYSLAIQSKYCLHNTHIRLGITSAVDLFLNSHKGPCITDLVLSLVILGGTESVKGVRLVRRIKSLGICPQKGL